MCDKCNNGNSFLVGTLLGTAIGVGLGLLLAPASGEETRRKLKTTGTKYLEKGQDIYEDVRTKAEPYVERFQRDVVPALKDLAEKAETMSAPAREELTERIKELADEVEEQVGENLRKVEKEKKVLKKRFFKGL